MAELNNTPPTPQMTPTMPLLGPALPPQPVQTTLALAEIPLNGQKYIVLQISTASGVQFVWLEKPNARQLGEQLVAIAGSGILLAPAGAVPRA